MIIGGGVSGLLANWVLAAQPHTDVRILEPGALGGQDLATFELVSRTDQLVLLLNSLGVSYSTYPPQGGILLRGKVRAYPNVLDKIGLEAALRIQADLHRKARLLNPDERSKRALLSNLKAPAQRAIRFHSGEVLTRLGKRARVTQAGVTQVTPQHVVDSHGRQHPYDFLVWTAPLWTARGMVPWAIPEAHVVRASIALVQPRRDRFAAWDWVHTPYTPAQCVHRIWCDGQSYYAEAAGCLDRAGLEDDLRFLFPDGYHLQAVGRDFHGHMMPLDHAPEWPRNVAPLGPFAQWDVTATADVVLERARRLAVDWLGARFDDENND